MTETTAHPSEQVIEYSEALATWTTRYLDPHGFECVLSLQAESGSEVLQKAEGAIHHLTEAQCRPLNGNNHHGSKPAPAKAENGESDNPICPIHQVEMKKWSKDGRTWYSHRWDGGWCKGK